MGWGEGSTRAWRKTRQTVLDRDDHRCQLNYPGCQGEATEVHHLTGIAGQGIPRRDATNPDECAAVCSPCHERETRTQQAAGRTKRPGRRRPRPHPADAA